MSEETHSDEETESLGGPSPGSKGVCVEQRQNGGNGQDGSPDNAAQGSDSPSGLMQHAREPMSSVQQQSDPAVLHKEQHVTTYNSSFASVVSDSVVPAEAGSGTAHHGLENFEEPLLLGADHGSQCVQAVESAPLSAAKSTKAETVVLDSSAKEGPADVTAVRQASGICGDPSICGTGDQVDTSHGNEVEVQSSQANESAAPSSPERLPVPGEMSHKTEDEEGKNITTVQQAEDEGGSKQASPPPKRSRKKSRDSRSEGLMDHDPVLAGIDTITLPRLGPNGHVDPQGGLLEISRYGRARMRPLAYWANERPIFGNKEQGVLGVSSGSQCGDLVGSFGTPITRKRAKPTKRAVVKELGEGRKTTVKKKGGEESAEIADRKVVGGRKRTAGATEDVKKHELEELGALKPNDTSSQKSIDPSGSDAVGLPPPAATTAGRKRGRPTGSKNKPKDNNNSDDQVAVLASDGLATLAAAAGSRAAAAAKGFPGGKSQESGARRGPSGGFVSLDRPQRCGTCAACAAGDRPCETLCALRALVSTPSSAAKPAPKKGRQNAKRNAEDDAQAGERNATTPLPANQKPLSSTTRGRKRSAPPTTTPHNEQEGTTGEDDWTAEQDSTLKSAWLDLDPKAPGFWGQVAARVGRSAAECSQRWYDSCPTPGPSAKRGAEALRPKLPKLGTSASAAGAPSKAVVQRVVKVARREARWETAAAAAERHGGAEAVAAMEEKRATQANTDRYIDQILRKRGGRAWSALVGNGRGLIAAAVSSSEDRARSRLAEEDARRDVQAALAQQQANASEDDDRDSNDESDYYWSDA